MGREAVNKIVAFAPTPRSRRHRFQETSPNNPKTTPGDRVQADGTRPGHTESGNFRSPSCAP